MSQADQVAKAHAPHENRLRHPSATSLPDLGSTTSTRSWVALAAVLLVMIAALAWGLFGVITVQTTIGAEAAGGGIVYQVTAPTNGVVKAIAPSGKIIGQGFPVAVIDPDDGGPEVPVASDKSVLISTWNVVLGSPVKVGDVIAQGVVFGIPPALAGVDSAQQIAAMTYVPANYVDTIKSAIGLQLVVKETDGDMKAFPATFISADAYPSSEERIALVTGNPTFASQVTETNEGETFAVYLGYANPEDKQALAESLKSGATPLITTGSAATLIITEAQSNPLQFLFGAGG